MEKPKNTSDLRGTPFTDILNAMSGVGGVEMDSINDGGDDGFQVSSRRRPKHSGGGQKQTQNQKQQKQNRQRRSANNHTGKRQTNRNAKSKKSFSAGGPSLSSRGWSKPSEGWDTTTTASTTTALTPGPGPQREAPPPRPPPGTDTAPADGSNAVEKAGHQHRSAPLSKQRDDAIDAALSGSSSSATTVSALMASMGFGAAAPPKLTTTTTTTTGETPAVRGGFASFARGQAMEDLLGDLGERDPRWKEKQFPAAAGSEDQHDHEDDAPAPGESFAAFCKGRSASELLADFGDADPHWKDKVVAVEEEEEQEEEEPAATAATTTTRTGAKTPGSSSSASRLAPHGKAAIHLSIESFGVVHGVPSRGSRDRSGSPFTQPLEWLDVGDDLVEPVPDRLAFHDGLRSGVIKRMLKSAPLLARDDGDYDDIDAGGAGGFRDFSAYCRDHLAERRVFPALLEAIHEGGHGYVSPLTMRVSVGSELGRHRSVVAVEWIAQHLRHLLRTHNSKNSSSNAGSGNGFRPIPCTVSVGTVHRDVQKRIPQKRYREDDEDGADGDDV